MNRSTGRLCGTLQAIAPQHCDQWAREPASTDAVWIADQFDVPKSGKTGRMNGLQLSWQAN